MSRVNKLGARTLQPYRRRTASPGGGKQVFLIALSVSFLVHQFNVFARHVNTASRLSSGVDAELQKSGQACFEEYLLYQLGDSHEHPAEGELMGIGTGKKLLKTDEGEASIYGGLERDRRGKNICHVVESSPGNGDLCTI